MGSRSGVAGALTANVVTSTQDIRLSAVSLLAMLFRRWAAQPGDGALRTRTGVSELSRCVSIDLEVSTETGRIHAFAGERRDTGRSVVFPQQGRTLDRALADLDDLTDGASSCSATISSSLTSPICMPRTPTYGC